MPRRKSLTGRVERMRHRQAVLRYRQRIECVSRTQVNDFRPLGDSNNKRNMQKTVPNTHSPTKKGQQMQKKVQREINDQTGFMKLDAEVEESEGDDEDIDDSDMEVDEAGSNNYDDDDEIPLPIDSEDEAELEAQRIRFNDLHATKAASSQLSSLSEIKGRGGNFECANNSSASIKQ